MQDTYVKIDLDLVSKNIHNIINKYSDYKYYIGVVKSDFYGHGKYILDELIAGGINYVAVSYLDEALEIRALNKDISILCLQPINLERIVEASINNITITIHDNLYFHEILKLNKNLKVHLKIDSGMNRLGIKEKGELKEIVNEINRSPNLYLEGIYTHFATTGLFDIHYDEQIKKFQEITSLININEIPIIHMGSSVIMVSHDKISFANGIRIGIMMYGYNVSYQKNSKGLKNKVRNLRNYFYKKRYNLSKTYTNVSLDLFPLVSFKTRIIALKKVTRGEYIGYGAKYKVKRNILLAILPVGYANGIGKNNKYFLINNQRYRTIDIDMNMTIIAVDEKVQMNDVVTIIGNEITLGVFARSEKISIAEALLNIGKLNKKVYIKNNRVKYVVNNGSLVYESNEVDI